MQMLLLWWGIGNGFTVWGSALWILLLWVFFRRGLQCIRVYCTSTLLTQVQFPSAARDFIPRVNFQCRLCYGARTPPCAITCVNICVHIKGPVARVRVRWIVGTLKHPACTIGWVAGLCHSWLSPKGKQPEFLMGEIPYWPYSWGGRSKHAKGRKQTSFSIKSLRLCLFSRNFLFFL